MNKIYTDGWQALWRQRVQALLCCWWWDLAIYKIILGYLIESVWLRIQSLVETRICQRCTEEAVRRFKLSVFEALETF